MRERGPNIWGEDGEFAIEWPGRVIVTFEAGVASYAICASDRWRAGNFSITIEPAKAAEEINAALAPPADERG